MKNKRIINILILTLAIGFLPSCQKNSAKKDVSFQTNIKYDEELSTQEMYELVLNFSNEMKNLKGQSTYSYMKQETKNNFYEVEAEGTLKLYNNYYSVSDNSLKMIFKNNGHTVNSKRKSRTETVIDEKNGKQIRLTKTDDEYSLNILDISDDFEHEKEHFYDTFREIPSAFDLDEGTAYKDGNNYVIFTSSIDEHYSPVAWGEDETKVVHTLIRSQTIIKIDKKYRITSMTSFSDHQTNRDEETGDFYKNDITVYKSISSYTFSYGSKGANTSGAEKLFQQFRNGYFTGSHAFTVYSATYDGSVGQETQKSIYEYQVKQLTPNKEEIMFYLILNTKTDKAFRLEAASSYFASLNVSTENMESLEVFPDIEGLIKLGEYYLVPENVDAINLSMKFVVTLNSGIPFIESTSAVIYFD